MPKYTVWRSIGEVAMPHYMDSTPRSTAGTAAGKQQTPSWIAKGTTTTAEAGNAQSITSHPISSPFQRKEDNN